MGKRKFEEVDLNAPEPRSEIDAWLNAAGGNQIVGNTVLANTTNCQSTSTSPSSVKPPLKEESGTGKPRGEPVGPMDKEGAQSSSKVPAVVNQEGEDEEDLHPFWQLLELAGYEML